METTPDLIVSPEQMSTEIVATLYQELERVSCEKGITIQMRDPLDTLGIPEVIREGATVLIDAAGVLSDFAGAAAAIAVVTKYAVARIKVSGKEIIISETMTDQQVLTRLLEEGLKQEDK